MDQEGLPPARYIGSEMVMRVLAEHGKDRIERLDAVRVLALGVLGGSFITTGALLAMLLGTGTQSEGSLRLLEGFGCRLGVSLLHCIGRFAKPFG